MDGALRDNQSVSMNIKKQIKDARFIDEFNKISFHK